MVCEFCQGECSCHINPPPCNFCTTHSECVACGKVFCSEDTDDALCPNCTTKAVLYIANEDTKMNFMTNKKEVKKDI